MTRQVNTKTQAYSNAFYAECDENAEETTTIDGTKVKVWRGFIGATCRKVGIPPGMDRKIVKPLEELGCISVVQRGVGRYPTVLALYYPPTEDLWVESDASRALTRRPSFAKLIQDVENLKRQMGGGNIIEALADHENRIKALESVKDQ